MAGKVRLWAIRKKKVFGISAVENFKIFLTPNFSLIKKLKFSEFSQFLQLDCASSVCPANFFSESLFNYLSNKHIFIWIEEGVRP